MDASAPSIPCPRSHIILRSLVAHDTVCTIFCTADGSTPEPRWNCGGTLPAGLVRQQPESALCRTGCREAFVRVRCQGGGDAPRGKACRKVYRSNVARTYVSDGKRCRKRARSQAKIVNARILPYRGKRVDDNFGRLKCRNMQVAAVRLGEPESIARNDWKPHRKSPELHLAFRSVLFLSPCIASALRCPTGWGTIAGSGSQYTSTSTRTPRPGGALFTATIFPTWKTRWEGVLRVS